MDWNISRCRGTLSRRKVQIAPACNDKSKRIPLGSKPGVPTIVADENFELLFQLTINADGRAKKEWTSGEVINKLLMLQPELERKQAENYVNNTFPKKREKKLGKDKIN